MLPLELIEGNSDSSQGSVADAAPLYLMELHWASFFC